MEEPEHLTHGWEPDTPASDSLVRQFLEGTAAAGSSWPRPSAGGRRGNRRRDGRPRVARVLRQHRRVARAVRTAGPRRRSSAPSTSSIHAETDRARLLALSRRGIFRADGFELIGHPPFMVRPAGGESPRRGVAGLEIRRVETAEEAANFGRLLAEAYPMPGAEVSPLVRTPVLDGPLRLFNGGTRWQTRRHRRHVELARRQRRRLDLGAAGDRGGRVSAPPSPMPPRSRTRRHRQC